MVVEEERVMEVADKVSGICRNFGIPIFKASYRKANRTSASSFTGIGNIAALTLLKKVGEKYNLPTLSDIHAHEEAALAAGYIDVLQYVFYFFVRAKKPCGFPKKCRKVGTGRDFEIQDFLFKLYFPAQHRCPSERLQLCLL